MEFKFKAQKTSGETYEGVRDVEDKFALYRDLKKEGDTVLSVTEQKTKKGFNISLASFSRIGMHEKITFARNLGSMLDAGLSVTRALSVMERQAKKPKLKKLLAELEDSVSQGLSLSDSIAKHADIFPSIFTFMVKAGEESGNLGKSLKVVSSQLEKIYVLKRKIKGAMIYPGIIISVMLAIGVLMMIFIVPTLTETFKELNAELPASTQAIIFVSDFLKNHIFASMGIVLAVIFGFIAFKRTQKGKRIIDLLVLHIPVVSGITRESNAAQTARTLSSLLSSGVDVVVATKITGDVLQNSYYKEILKIAEEDIQKGKTISSVFTGRENFYPVFVAEMVSVGEETGKLPDMLMQVAEFYENEVEQKTKDMSTIIEPFLMVFIGLVVGFFAIAMIGPTYSLVNNI